MKIRIEELVDKSTDDRPLVKALACLAELRDKCEAGMTDEPAQFNEVWEELERKYRNNKAIAFWVKVLEKGEKVARISIPDEGDAARSVPADEPAEAAAHEDAVAFSFSQSSTPAALT